jgi:hypothetical protein
MSTQGARLRLSQQRNGANSSSPMPLCSCVAAWLAQLSKFVGSVVCGDFVGFSKRGAIEVHPQLCAHNHSRGVAIPICQMPVFPEG